MAKKANKIKQKRSTEEQRKPITSLRALADAISQQRGKRISHTAVAKWMHADWWRWGTLPLDPRYLAAIVKAADENQQEDRAREFDEDGPAQRKQMKGRSDDEGSGDGGGDSQDVDPAVEIEELRKRGDIKAARSIAALMRTLEQTAAIRVKRMIDEREYIARDEAEEVNAAKERAVKTAIQQIPKALRQIMADTNDAAKCEEIMANAFRRVLNEGFGGVEIN